MWSEEEEGVIEMTMNDHEGGGGFHGMNTRLRGLRYMYFALNKKKIERILSIWGVGQMTTFDQGGGGGTKIWPRGI